MFDLWLTIDFLHCRIMADKDSSGGTNLGGGPQNATDGLAALAASYARYVIFILTCFQCCMFVSLCSEMFVTFANYFIKLAVALIFGPLQVQ